MIFQSCRTDTFLIILFPYFCDFDNYNINITNLIFSNHYQLCECWSFYPSLPEGSFVVIDALLRVPLAFINEITLLCNKYLNTGSRFYINIHISITGSLWAILWKLCLIVSVKYSSIFYLWHLLKKEHITHLSLRILHIVFNCISLLNYMAFWIALNKQYIYNGSLIFSNVNVITSCVIIVNITLVIFYFMRRRNSAEVTIWIWSHVNTMNRYFYIFMNVMNNILKENHYFLWYIYNYIFISCTFALVLR